MAEQRQPHWMVPVIVGLALTVIVGLFVAWQGWNDLRFPWVKVPTSGGTAPTNGSNGGAGQTTEYERLSVNSLSGPPRSLLGTPPAKGDFNCLSYDSWLPSQSDFMWIKDVQAHEDRPWHGDGLQVEDGHIYMLAIYPVNCGLATSNPDDGILRDATLRIDVPSRSDTSMRLGAILRSSYLDHPVWDGVRLSGPRPFTVIPIPGSVQYMSSSIAESDQKRLPDALFGTAQLIGDKGQDGILRACAKPGDPKSVDCHLLIYAQVQVHMS
jgi:hypothetical protein